LTLDTEQLAEEERHERAQQIKAALGKDFDMFHCYDCAIVAMMYLDHYISEIEGRERR
jgi:hypothetical protein